MKTKKTVSLLAFLTLAYLNGFSQDQQAPFNEPQYNKPALFADLPNKLDIKIANLEALLTLPVGTAVSAVIADGFPLTGKIVSKSNPADRTVQSVVVKSLSRVGATLSFSRIKAEDGSVSFAGRIISRANGDAMEIVKEGSQYIITKKGYYDLISE